MPDRCELAQTETDRCRCFVAACDCFRPLIVARTRHHIEIMERGMEREPIISLQCIRKDGRRETTKLRDHPISDARELAKWVLHIGNGMYTEVEIWIEDGYVEKVQNPCITDTVWMT